MPIPPVSDEPRIFKPPRKGQSIHVDGKFYVIGEFIGNGYFGNV